MSSFHRRLAIIFRDGKTPFSEDDGNALKAISPIFATSLATMVKGDEDEGGDQRDRPWGPHVEADCQHDPNADAEEIDHGLERIADTEPHQVFPRKSRPWDAQSRLRLRRLGRSQGCHDGRLAWKRMTPVFDSNASRALIGTSATRSGA